MVDIAVLATGADDEPARALAERLGLPIVEDGDAHEFVFSYQPEGLTLIHHDAGQSLALRAEWLTGKAAHRQGQPEMINRALGLSKLDHPHVVDATAGLGRDSVVIASLGASVTAIERSPYVFALLEDAWKRANADANAGGWAGRIELIQQDTVHALPSLSSERPVDVVFLDPMYPEKSKKALAKKDMRLFQRLLGHSERTLDEAVLLSVARETAIYRVVVKRPIKGQFLAGQKPSFSIKGRSTRFDVYTNKKVI